MSAKNRSPQKVGIEERTDAKGRTQYRGLVYDRLSRRKVRGAWTFSLAEARGWRVSAMAKLDAGLLSGERGPTVREAADEFVRGIRSGAIRNRSGRAYKPSAIRGYDRELTSCVVPEFGPRRLSDIRLPEVQRWADSLVADGLAPSTVRNVVNAVRALYAWATPRGLATINPTIGLRLPTGERKRDRIAPLHEADALLASLRPEDRPVWATALYSGLRLGELMALRVSDVDLDARTIRVDPERGSYDPVARVFGPPKSDAGAREVPIMAKLYLHLAAAVDGKPSPALVFGRDHATPFAPSAVVQRARRAWTTAGLAPLGFHEARHTFASYLIAAGVTDLKALTTVMGHSTVMITLDRYGHLLPGSTNRVRDLFDAWAGAAVA